MLLIYEQLLTFHPNNSLTRYLRAYLINTSPEILVSVVAVSAAPAMMSSPTKASAVTATPVMTTAPTEISVGPVSVIAIWPISVRLVAIIEAVIRTISIISYGVTIRIGINGATLYY
jgi:hypothetical protein